MDFKNMLEFLSALDRNNHKSWMDDHRGHYHQVRDDFIAWLDQLDLKLAARDPEYYPTPGRQGINRINNNLLYHPDRPVYKDHFGAGLDKAPGTADFYIQIGIRESILAGGVWRPGAGRLRKIREAIDYDGEVLKEHINHPRFQKLFGGLYPDQALTRMPKGYPADHPHAELLKLKTFAVARPLSHEQILGPGFEDLILETYDAMLPFRRYLNRALSV